MAAGLYLTCLHKHKVNSSTIRFKPHIPPQPLSTQTPKKTTTLNNNWYLTSIGSPPFPLLFLEQYTSLPWMLLSLSDLPHWKHIEAPTVFPQPQGEFLHLNYKENFQFSFYVLYWFHIPGLFCVIYLEISLKSCSSPTNSKSYQLFGFPIQQFQR